MLGENKDLCSLTSNYKTPAFLMRHCRYSCLSMEKMPCNRRKYTNMAQSLSGRGQGLSRYIIMLRKSKRLDKLLFRFLSL